MTPNQDPHAGSSSSAILFRTGDSRSVHQLLSSLERGAEDEPLLLFSGGCRGGLRRPFAGLLELAEQVALAAYAEEPLLIGRFSLALVNLLPAWRAKDRLRRVRTLRSGLADYIFHNDPAGLKHFYWKRDVAPWMAADLIHFLIETAYVLQRHHGKGVALCLENLHLASDTTLDTIRLLACYAQKAPVRVIACGDLSDRQHSLLMGNPPFASIGSARDVASDIQEPLRDQLTDLERQILEAASVAVAPSTTADLARWTGDEGQSVEAAVDALATHGWLRRLDDRHLAPASGWVRDTIYLGLSEESRRRWHRTVTEVERADPFAATWHAVGAGLDNDQISRAALRALEQAWGVSDCDLALELCGTALEARQHLGELDQDMLLALLNYDAGHAAATDRHLLAALEKRPDAGHERFNLIRLLGYNATFGLNDFDRGRELLSSLIAPYEAMEMEEHAGYLRNGVAYALFRLGRYDEAIEMEKLALAQLRKATPNSAFLFSILQLNLGRLFRQLGFSEEALELFRDAMDEDFSPYMLQIFYTTLAQLHSHRGEDSDALQAHHLCFELARDLDLENASYPVINTLSRPVSVKGQLTRGDEVFFYLSLHSAMVCRRLGIESRARSYIDALRSRWTFLPDDVWRQVEAALAEIEPTALAVVPEGGAPHPAFALAAEKATARFPELLADVATVPQQVESMVQALLEERSVAILRPRAVGGDTELLDCLVIYDPRSHGLAGRLNPELGVASGFYPPSFGDTRPSARVALALPEALKRCIEPPHPSPLILQEATLTPEARDELPALGPYRVRFQLLTAESDSFLHRILTAFAERSGIPALAVVPFHLRRRILPSTPEQAVNAFLASPIDHLALGDRLLSKRHGAHGAENLLPFRPRLSFQASVLEPVDDTADNFHIRIRNFAYQSDVKLRRELRPLIELSDGQCSIADILDHLTDHFPTADAAWRRQACDLYRKLWRQGAITFRAPKSS